MNQPHLTDVLADKVAEDYLVQSLSIAAMAAISGSMAEDIVGWWREMGIIDDVAKELLDNIMPSVNEFQHLAHFEKLFKSLLPWERKYKAMLRTVWAKEEKIIVANLKKMKKAWLQKDKIDEILYPQAQFEKELSENALKIDVAIIDEQGKAEMARLAATDVMFDVSNPEVQNWLNSYTPKFSKALEEINVAKLRRELTQGIAAGEGVPGLIKRVNGTYAHWNKVRSETIARSEALRASNRASLEAYKQSGVVKKKVWITHFSAATCEVCRSLNNKVISLEKNFFNQGDIARAGKQTIKLDYENVESPPLHPRCRCTVAASFEEGEGKPPPPGEAGEVARKPRKPFKSLKEAEEWGKQYGIKGLTVGNKKLSLKEWNLIAKEVDKVPKGLLAKVAKNGGSMDLVVNSGITIHPSYKHLKGKIPRGWEGTGKGWDNIPGAGGTWNKPKTILVANKTGVGHGSINLTLHEHGHTVDAIFTKGSSTLSGSNKWQGIWKTNSNKGLIASPYEADYAEEYFAEKFAEYFNSSGHGYCPKNVITYFDNLVKSAGGG